MLSAIVVLDVEDISIQAILEDIDARELIAVLFDGNLRKNAIVRINALFQQVAH